MKTKVEVNKLGLSNWPELANLPSKIAEIVCYSIYDERVLVQFPFENDYLHRGASIQIGGYYSEVRDCFWLYPTEFTVLSVKEYTYEEML